MFSFYFLGEITRLNKLYLDTQFHGQSKVLDLDISVTAEK